MISRRLSLALVVALAFLSGCGATRAPVAPGEIPRGTYTTAQDEQYGQEVLSSLMKNYPLSHDDRDINRVRDIVDQLARAAGANDSPWNVYVLRGPDVVNAAATRGHFVFVWTGMLDLVQNDGELAAVLAHEMGHVLADHTQPTPSEEAGQIMANVGSNVANQVVAVQGPYGALAGLAGIVAQEAIEALIVNPESQRKEFEADHIGLFLMADAGFDPRSALSLWSAMSQQGNDLGPLTFLSSHPASDERLAELEALLPQAMERYRVAKNMPPRAKGTRRPQFEPDSFVVGRDPQQKRPPGWRALEDGTTIFSAPNTLSRPLHRLARDEPLSIGFRSGAWYEVSEPVAGYVLGVEIYQERN